MVPGPKAQSVVLQTWEHEVRSPARPIFFPRIDDSHCDRIHSSLTTVRCFDNGYLGKLPVAWKEYCAEYWLKEVPYRVENFVRKGEIACYKQFLLFSQCFLQNAVLCVNGLTHYQTTNFRLFRTKKVCRRQFHIWRKWQKVIQMGRKHCGKRRNCLLRAISPFPTVFSKGLFPKGVKRCRRVGMGQHSVKFQFSSFLCKKIFRSCLIFGHVQYQIVSQIVSCWFISFPNTTFWNCPKFKEDADDNWNVAIEGFQDTDCIENIVEKGEIAHF